jgi:hypothetical protein
MAAPLIEALPGTHEVLARLGAKVLSAGRVEWICAGSL